MDNKGQQQSYPPPSYQPPPQSASYNPPAQSQSYQQFQNQAQQPYGQQQPYQQHAPYGGQQPYGQQPYAQNQPYYSQPPPQTVYVQQQPQQRADGSDALCLGCLAALCFCCTMDMLF